jgi:cation diffusion facilitator CzcD-associated flavoprotein CzcO
LSYQGSDDHCLEQLFEKRSSLGGVWRDAKWPGAGVDVPIHLYSLFSDLKSDWSRVFAEQPEVLAYWESLVDKHSLRGNIVLRTEYVESSWDSRDQRHVIKLRRDDGFEFEHRANVIISANGPLSKPTTPDLPGLETFEGQQFHNLHWDESVDLRNKRVAVIGNGSSGIQLVVSGTLTSTTTMTGPSDTIEVGLTVYVSPMYSPESRRSREFV